jgi:hypothetical protein
MAVSNSSDFSLTVADLIAEARRKIGVHSDEEPLEAQDLQTAMKTLNLMMKAWQAEGVMTWTYTEGTLALAQGDADYAFGSGGAFTTVPVDILDMRINRGGNDLPMCRMSREEYFCLPNKTTQGYPTQWYYDRQRQGGTLYVWPVPDATAGTLKFTYRRPIMDLDAGPNDFDIPQEWFDAVVYNLADRLAENYGLSNTPTGQKVTAKAIQSYQMVKNFDTGEGRGSLLITPFGDDRGYY